MVHLSSVSAQPAAQPAVSAAQPSPVDGFWLGTLAEWHRDLGADGLVILGVTRYYGHADGFDVDAVNEIAFLKSFKIKQDLPYDFVVTKDQALQQAYAATGLPTAVLIDRKGVIRYIESGTNPTRIEEMRDMVLKLLAEK